MSIQKKQLHFCILIPCYNDEQGLIEALQSVQYPAENFLTVIVDDGSQIPLSRGALEKVLGKVLPFHLIQLPQNKGITEALNAGLNWILQHTESDFIARLDCRDTCHPERFFRQVQFLNAHPPIGLLGSWCRFEEKNTSYSYTYKTPTKHNSIIKAMHLRNVFIHPTVMFRTHLVQKAGFYPSQYPAAEDYAFFWTICRYVETAILNQVLITCAINRQGISYQKRKEQLASRRRIVSRYSTHVVMKKLGLLKIDLLQLIPYSFIMYVKNRATL